MTRFGAQPEQFRILVVDDEPHIRLLMRRSLERQQYVVAEAENGIAALERFQEFHPHAVLMDALMPEMDGFTACARIQELSTGVQTPVLMVTALDDDQSLQRAYAAGAADFISKPIRWAVLYHRLAWLLKVREAQEALHISEEYYRQLVDNAPLGVAVIDDQGAIVSHNQVFGDLLRRLVVAPVATNNVLVHPCLADTEIAASIRRCLAERTGMVLESTLHGTAQEALHLRIHLAPLEQGDGRVSAQALIEDVTELRHMESQRSHAQKLEAVGALAAGIAHEINTPTQFVSDNVHFLSDAFGDLTELLNAYAELRAVAQEHQLPPDLLARISAAETAAEIAYLRQEIPAAISQTLEGIQRVTSIVRAMRTFAHPASEAKSSADLNQALQTALTVARNEYKYVADVVTDLDPDLPLVSCYLGDLNQVFLNLLVNAAHAIRARMEAGGPKRGTIMVCTRHEAPHVRITVADTGTGIAAGVRDRIFDPFFTTKPVGQGTGQGLSIAHAIVVKKHGGQLSFETEIGKGTQFTIILPVHANGATDALA